MDSITYIHDLLTNMNKFNKLIVDFLDDDSDVEASYQNLTQYLDDHNIRQEKYDLKLILHTISDISNNHLRTPNFFNKVEQIVKLLSEDINRYFTNIEIFNIFKENKRLLLFLFTEQIITPDAQMYQIIMSGDFKDKNYPRFFFPEFKPFFTQKALKKTVFSEGSQIDLESESFLEKRKIGENDNDACAVIRNDSIDEFKANFDNKKTFWGFHEISDSIFETNPFLINKDIGYLEYSAFCGAIKIFKHLIQKEGTRLSSKILPFAAHSKNNELIQLIEKNIEVDKSDAKLAKCYIEALKDHHFEQADYLYEKYFKDNQEINRKNSLLCLKYHNFVNFNDVVINDVTDSYKLANNSAEGSDEEKMNNVFCVICESDFVTFADLFVKAKNLNVNIPMIIKKILLIKFQICVLFNVILNVNFFNEIKT